MTTSSIVCLLPLFLVFLVTTIEGGIIRHKSGVAEHYGIELNSSQAVQRHQRLRRHRRHPEPEPQKRAKICYFSPIQCLFTRPA
ncbi:hypothetical protein AAVH_26933 [Aphelenchoides avenae]|nr:hypothetical protein AAVH_26933 [Aphelenchus avenae]